MCNYELGSNQQIFIYFFCQNILEDPHHLLLNLMVSLISSFEMTQMAINIPCSFYYFQVKSLSCHLCLLSYHSCPLKENFQNQILIFDVPLCKFSFVSSLRELEQSHQTSLGSSSLTDWSNFHQYREAKQIKVFHLFNLYHNSEGFTNSFDL